MGRSIKVHQDQDIKGFTLLELLVVVALVSIITAIGLPNFNNWKKEREVRVAAEKIAGVLSGVNAQTKRGSYPYVQMLITSNMTISGSTGNFQGTLVSGRGMTKTNLTTSLNSGKFPNCDMNVTMQTGSGKWEMPSFAHELKNIYLHVGSTNAICFSADEKYYAVNGNNLPRNKNIRLDQGTTDRYIIVCPYQDAKNAGKGGTSSPGLKKPAYLIQWSRFGNIRKYRWSGSDWVR